MNVVYGARSDTGLKRSTNEDRFWADPEMGLYIVCDGMGGQNAGERASQLAIDAIARHCREAARDGSPEMLGVYDPAFLPQTNRLASAICHANHLIHRAAQNDARYMGMGTTVVSALLQGPVLSIAHVGDSRLYVIKGDSVQPLTADHSLVMDQVRAGSLTEEEAERSPQKNILTRAVGLEPTVDVELGEAPLVEGDILLLCSDGLTRMIPPRDILQAIKESGDLGSASKRLIEMANAVGGDDNTTVLLIAVQEDNRRTLWGRILDWITGTCRAVSTGKEG